MARYAKPKDLPVYVLYNNTTTDYPGEWVVRKQWSSAGKVTKDPKLSARGKTREECLTNLLADCPQVGTMTFLERYPDDDPCIAGTFL